MIKYHRTIPFLKTITRAVIVGLLLLTGTYSWAQNEIWIKPNKGQWHDNVEYRIGIPGGFMYLENGGFTYQLTNYQHYHEGHDNDHEAEPYAHHIVRSKFLGANLNPSFLELKPSSFVENYITGNDPSGWASNVSVYNEVQYIGLYNGIDLRMYEKDAGLKYDVIVHPGISPSAFKVQYTGQDAVSIDNDQVVIETQFGTITEGKPVAWQMIGMNKIDVACEYKLVGNVMEFVFPEGYDDDYILVIDPDLTFSTFTGSTADNWGMTACPDINKDLIAAGVVFGTGYPISSGYDATFNGGHTDIGLTKFSSDGASLVYSTYIGGNGSETPHSIIVNAANELYMMGATSSANFPIPPTGYQTLHKGGPALTVDGMNFAAGADIFVLRMSATGATLTGATYLGGTATDGISEGTVAFNYGDRLRGEVFVDAASNVYVSSVSRSSNFPIAGGGDGTLGGLQDAVVAKLNPALTALNWSSYLGGTGLEAGNSVQLDGAGNIFVAGGTTSADLPNTAGKMNPTYKGGIVDGYVYKYNAPGYGTSGGSYLGTTDYDQAYFVQLDIDDFVYVYGQTRGAYPVTAGVYANPNSGQFIHKISNNLVTNQWSSVFGSGSGDEELSPTAFLVSDCYEIYIAGWGGNTNVNNSTAINSSSAGMPVSADAYQPTTNGSNFYLALFTQDMATFKYGTYMGSLTTNGDHVDGGTSRFDKSGGVYHAVCAACGGNPNGFPTSSGVWSTTNESSNCNMAAFQFELAKLDASIGLGSPVICIPDPVTFDNTSVNGDTYFWDFGDGGTSTDYEPTHTYLTPGDYTVMLIVSHSSGCYIPDTAYFDVHVELLEALAGTMIDTICPGSSVELWATGGDTYSWVPGDVLDDPSSSNPIATIWEETTFTVTVESECGITVVEVTVYVHEVSTSAWGDTAICKGDSTQIFAAGGDTYVWTPGATLDDPTSPSPWASPIVTTYYFVEITTVDDCKIKDTVKVHVDQDLPYPNLIDQVNLCLGESVQIAAHGATSYLWSPNYNISAVDIYNPWVYPTVDTSYLVAFTNACGTTFDSVFVNVIEIQATACPDTTICPGTEAVLWASGGEHYKWVPNSHISSTTDSIVTVSPWFETTYTVIVSDDYGCSDMAVVTVHTYTPPTITVCPDIYAIVGDSVQLSATAPGFIEWSPPYNISCLICDDPLVWPEHQQTYMATVTDEHGCQAIGNVTVFFDPLLYVPNVFTPDGNGYNPTFFAVGANITKLETLIFNRWGELVWTGYSLNDAWDGTYNGVIVPDDVYVWYIKYTDVNSQDYEVRGHVTVLK